MYRQEIKPSVKHGAWTADNGHQTAELEQQPVDLSINLAVIDSTS